MNKSSQDPQPIGPLIKQVLSENGYLSISREYGVVQKWEAIAPERLAAASRCERIENGILYVRVASAPWRHEAVYLKEQILLKIKRDFDCHTIKDIVFY